MTDFNASAENGSAPTDDAAQTTNQPADTLDACSECGRERLSDGLTTIDDDTLVCPDCEETPSADVWDLLGFITSSQYREIVLDELAVCPKTPSTIADDGDIAITHVSRALTEMGDRGLVELLVPEDRRKGRIYGLTTDGEHVVDTYANQLAADGGIQE